MTLPPVARQVNMVPFVGQFLVDDPGYVFFLISTVLLMVYGSLALRSVHRFGWIRTTITALLPLSSLPVSIILYYIKHIMSFKWRPCLNYNLILYGVSDPPALNPYDQIFLSIDGSDILLSSPLWDADNLRERTMGTFVRGVPSPVDVLPLPFPTVTSRSQFFSPKNRPRQAFSEARSAWTSLFFEW